MSLKLLLVSIDGTLTHDGKISRQIATDLGRLVRELEKRGVTTVLWSNRNWRVGDVPMRQFFSNIAGVDVPVHGSGVDGSPARVLQNSAAPILARYGVQPHENRACWRNERRYARGRSKPTYLGAPRLVRSADGIWVSREQCWRIGSVLFCFCTQRTSHILARPARQPRYQCWWTVFHKYRKVRRLRWRRASVRKTWPGPSRFLVLFHCFVAVLRRTSPRD